MGMKQQKILQISLESPYYVEKKLASKLPALE
jgi:hypothetical protein